MTVLKPEAHHSVITGETNSNFGFNLPWWDRLLGTYRSQPADGHEGMTIGLSQFRDQRVTWLHWMLLLPFVGRISEYSIKRRQRDRDRRNLNYNRVGMMASSKKWLGR